MEQKKQVKRTAKLASPNKKQPKTAKEKKPRKITNKAATFKELIVWISNGKTVTSFCDNRNLLYSDIMNIVNQNHEYLKLYRIARDLQSDNLFEKTLDLASARLNDTMPFVGQNHIKRDELIIKTIQYRISKLKPHQYGENVDLDRDTEKQPIKTVLADGRSLDDLISELQAKL